MRASRYLLACYPAVLVVAGNLLGNWWTALNLVNALVVMTCYECWLGKEDRADNEITDHSLPDMVLYFQAALHTVVILSLLAGIYSGMVQGWFVPVAAVSTGLFAGQSGVVNAHELIHRRKFGERLLGIWSMMLVNYGHFFVEHVRGHHRFVGTPRDPATARLGESIYAFVLRTVPQQFASACALEAERLTRHGKKFWSSDNIVLRVVVLQLLLCVTIGGLLGATALMAYLLCSVVAVLLLEYVNYIEHYGLVRQDNERVNAMHSWQSDVTFSRFTLVELSRHADHHNLASKPYHTLVSHDDSPVLPGGYYALFYRVMIPSVWFRSVHPIIAKHQSQTNAR